MKKVDKQSTHFIEQKMLLGGISPKQFLKEYWQKKPLLIRQAIPDFEGLLDGNELAGLACEEDVQSRLVSFSRGKWQLEDGPFPEKRFSTLPKSNWTLLVQGVNHHLPEAAELLKLFNFIPHARLDDLMVSFAPNGGGVGPHFDSYDVFLLQGQGKRRWRISQQTDLSLVDDAPLRILQNFETEQEYLLAAGDMLYLPPHVAHWGVAVGDCMTYSIGFRAPSAQELGMQFLSFLQDNMSLTGMYTDHNLALQKHPAELSVDMVKRVNAMLKKIRWNKDMVAGFLGAYLSEPKPHIIFDRPKRTSFKTFKNKLSAKGLKLNLKSQLLFYENQFFINGERVEMQANWLVCLKYLADNRYLPPAMIKQALLDEALLMCLYNWYQVGYLDFN
ncbi:MAG: cupin domain-containing protein [Methylophilaceae bacterium]|nr:cupin domain-containing protein [Methylophilaceae bacterium]